MKTKNYSHIIHLSGTTPVTCHGHTDESAVELATRYYEGKYKKAVIVEDSNGKILYKTA